MHIYYNYKLLALIMYCYVYTSFLQSNQTLYVYTTHNNCFLHDLINNYYDNYSVLDNKSLSHDMICIYIII